MLIEFEGQLTALQNCWSQFYLFDRSLVVLPGEEFPTEKYSLCFRVVSIIADFVSKL